MSEALVPAGCSYHSWSAHNEGLEGERRERVVKEDEDKLSLQLNGPRQRLGRSKRSLNGEMSRGRESLRMLSREQVHASDTNSDSDTAPCGLSVGRRGSIT